MGRYQALFVNAAESGHDCDGVCVLELLDQFVLFYSTGGCLVIHQHFLVQNGISPVIYRGDFFICTKLVSEF